MTSLLSTKLRQVAAGTHHCVALVAPGLVARQQGTTGDPAPPWDEDHHESTWARGCCHLGSASSLATLLVVGSWLAVQLVNEVQPTTHGGQDSPDMIKDGDQGNNIYCSEPLVDDSSRDPTSHFGDDPSRFQSLS